MQIDEALIRELAPTGRLRAALNMGNPVLAQSHTAADAPAGVTIDLARKLAGLLGVDVQLMEFASAGLSGAALAAGEADVGFMAVDPKRAETLHFTAPYVQIEGCYVVREGSPLQHNDEVDRPGTRVVIGTGSAYGLFLARHLKQAQLVDVPTSEEVTDKLVADPSLDVAAGVRQQLVADVRRLPGLRLLPGAFMTIQQCMALPRTRSAEAKRMLELFMGEQRASGYVQQALDRHGMEGVTALP